MLSERYLISNQTTFWLPVCEKKNFFYCCFVCNLGKKFRVRTLDVEDEYSSWQTSKMSAQTSSRVELEDSVEYWLFPNIFEGEDELEKLEAFRTRCFTFVHDQSRNYIWHEDSIKLNIIPNRTAGNYTMCVSPCSMINSRLRYILSLCVVLPAYHLGNGQFQSLGFPGFVIITLGCGALHRTVGVRPLSSFGLERLSRL